MNETFLTEYEVAERLNISSRQALKLMMKADIRKFQYGRLVRVRPEDLEAFIEANLSEKTKNLPTVAAASKSNVETPSDKGDLYV